ncbi:MAG: RAMP superfamily CRISPR-associated protein, partial [Armatimonadota bacterium]
AVDTFPMAESIDDSNIALLLPGSSIKGALRTRAEKIMRTLLDLNPIGDFNEQVKVPVVDVLFGSAKTKNDEKASSNNAGQSVAFFTDCYSTNTINQSNWDAIIKESDEFDLNAIINPTDESDLNENLKDIKNIKFQESYHVAIDRWTNAVLDGALYTVLEPHKVEWEPIEIILDFSRIKDVDTDKYKCLLLLVMRDFSRGDIPLGFSVNRGMGEVEVDNITIYGGNLNGITIKNGEISPEDSLIDLQDKWSSFLTKKGVTANG